jgi:hypothetical protein
MLRGAEHAECEAAVQSWENALNDRSGSILPGRETVEVFCQAEGCRDSLASALHIDAVRYGTGPMCTGARAVRFIMDWTCREEAGEYCLETLGQIERLLNETLRVEGLNITPPPAAALRRLCGRCVRDLVRTADALLVAVADVGVEVDLGLDGVDLSAVLGTLCTKFQGEYCIYHLVDNVLEIAFSLVQPGTPNLNTMCQPCVKNTIGTLLSIATNIDEVARFLPSDPGLPFDLSVGHYLQAACYNDENGRRCGAVYDRNAADTAVAMAASGCVANATLCTSACSSGVSAMSDAMGACCTGAFTGVASRYPSSWSTAGAATAVRECGVVPRCTAGAQTAVLEVSLGNINLEALEGQASTEAAVVEALAEDIAELAGVPSTAVTSVTMRTGANGEVVAEVDIETPEAAVAVAEVYSAVQEGTAPMTHTVEVLASDPVVFNDDSGIVDVGCASEDCDNINNREISGAAAWRLSAALWATFLLAMTAVFVQ